MKDVEEMQSNQEPPCVFDVNSADLNMPSLRDVESSAEKLKELAKPGKCAAIGEVSEDL